MLVVESPVDDQGQKTLLKPMQGIYGEQQLLKEQHRLDY